MTEIEKIIEWLQTSEYGYVSTQSIVPIFDAAGNVSGPALEYKIEIYSDKACKMYIADIVCYPDMRGMFAGALECKGGPFTSILSSIAGRMSAEDAIKKLQGWRK